MAKTSCFWFMLALFFLMPIAVVALPFGSTDGTDANNIAFNATLLGAGVVTAIGLYLYGKNSSQYQNLKFENVSNGTQLQINCMNNMGVTDDGSCKKYYDYASKPTPHEDRNPIIDFAIGGCVYDKSPGWCAFDILTWIPLGWIGKARVKVQKLLQLLQRLARLEKPEDGLIRH